MGRERGREKDTEKEVDANGQADVSQARFPTVATHRNGDSRLRLRVR